MKFSEIVKQAISLLNESRRITYRALKREFSLDEDALEDLKSELIDAQQVAHDEDGKVLVWSGTTSGQSAESKEQSSSLPPHTTDAALRTPHVERSAAERRQLTVMFCDLVGSTALSTQIDPEELRDIVRGYQHTSAMVIERFGGHIAQYLGDGLLVYFGYPVAHEDDAVRAVRAGLAILQALKQQPTDDGKHNHRPQLQVRIGVHTGLVVVGEMGGGQRQEQLALGETPNIAARVQGTAQPDEVIISAATYRLVEGLFVCDERGQPQLKGVATPLTLYRVVKESEVQSRFQVVARHGLTPLVGREHEYGLLQDRWQRAKEGAGQIVLLSGEPGIGKSRLVEALKAHVEHEGARCVELRCSPYAQNSALHPVIEHLHRTLHFRPEDAADEKLQKLKGGVPQVLPLPETTALLAALLSLPHPADVPPLTLSPHKQKEKTYEVLVAWLCAEAKKQAVTYAWEDLHWADPSTLELLSLFLQQAPTSRLLTVLTYRPEFHPPWGSHSYLSQLTLSRLAQNHVEAMVDKVTGGKALPAEILRQITNKTDGVPLFVEELTKMVVESGLVREVNGHYELTGPLPPLAIPSTLHDSLMARLDRLATVREIAQIAATIGREFTYEVLKAVSPLKDDALQQGLQQLVDTEFVFQSGVPPHARYLFKHALVQDTAYQSLLKSRRQQLHQQVAHVLVEQFPTTVETQPEVVAHHYTEAGLVEHAIPYWQQAGQKAVARSANAEAIRHLSTAIALVTSLPETGARTETELALHITLGASLMAAKGWAAPEVAQVYARAHELSHKVGETPHLFSVLRGLLTFYFTRAELNTAYKLGMQLFRIAQREQNRSHLLSAHLTLGFTLFHRGELVAARDYFEQGIALYTPQRYQSLRALQDPKIVCLSYGAWVLWHLGYPDQALRWSLDAVTLAQERGHAFSVAMALVSAGRVHHLRGEHQAVQEITEQLLQLSADQAFPSWAVEGTMLQGWERLEHGQIAEGIEQIQHSLAAYRPMGIAINGTIALGMLAKGYHRLEQAERGLDVLAEAFATMQKTGERFWEAELVRLSGDLLLSRDRTERKARSKEQTPEEPRFNLPVHDPHGGTEAPFLRALDIARQQHAKSLELRATMSLARLWQQQGKRAEAHQMLSEIYHWFTEGFDTKDLQEAKALLKSLV